jgi:hypothetical protein
MWTCACAAFRRPGNRRRLNEDDADVLAVRAGWPPGGTPLAPGATYVSDGNDFLIQVAAAWMPPIWRCSRASRCLL